VPSKKTLKKAARPAAHAKKPSEPKALETVSFVSLGCPKNLVDSEKMLGMLAESGLAPLSYDGSADFGGADVVVINTCGFLEASKDESLGVIHEAIRAKEKGDVQRVVVAGCLVQRHRAKMLDWAPGIDAMVGVFDRDKIVEATYGATKASKMRDENSPRSGEVPNYWIAGNALQAAKSRGMKTAGLTVNGKDGNGLGYFEDDSARLRLTPRHYSYLRMSEGCNQNCAFCTIPSIRGKMRSKPMDRVASEAKELVHDGAFEIMLIGQDTTSYGDDIGFGLTINGKPTKTSKQDLFASGLPALLKSVSDAMEEAGGGGPGAGWLRLMYAYPTNFSQPIVEAFAELTRTGRLLPYLDIPLQHASDRVLNLMRRNVTRHQQEDLMRRLRAAIPKMAIRTTFISGFPGETDDDHKQLLDFIAEMKFENVGVFEYSHEPGTVAATMEKDPALAVPAEIKARRRNEVMELQQRIVFARNEALAAKFNEKKPLNADGSINGVQVDVLIDEPLRTSGTKTTGVTDGGRLYRGRTYAQAPQIDGSTFVQSKEKLAPGELVRCTIVNWDTYDLVARPSAELEKKVALKILK
jgi:ribosomal protein S12 methylthiotransferase